MDCMPENETVAFGPYTLNAVQRILRLDGTAISIGSRSLDVLIALVERAGEVVSPRELMAKAWPGLTVEEGNLRVTLSSLRKALGEGQGATRYIVNVPGRGYSFVASVERNIGQSPPQATPSPQNVMPSLTNLPAMPRRMVGRAETVARLEELLAQRRFVTIVGPGGMGKTTVATAVAHARLKIFTNAVYFVDFATLTEPSLLVTSVAAALGVSVQANDPIPSLISWFAERPALLVLDSCEHVIDQVADLAERLFVSSPLLTILATSREALRVDGEQVHILSSLAGPEGTELTAAETMAFPAVQLFMERAFASGRLTDLKDDEAAVVSEICHRLDGLPLALELAGSRVGTYGVQGTASLLNSRFRLLWEGRRSALPRHQTLQAMLDWSYNLLSERERLVLRRLSVFVGFFEMEAAHAVTSDDQLTDFEVSGAISSLVDKSLLASSAVLGVTQFRLLDTTRSYAAAKLAGSADAAPVQQKHALFYAEFSIGFGTFGEDLPNKAILSQQIGNIRAALTWAFSPSGDEAIGAELAARASKPFLNLGLLTECRHWCGLALKRQSIEEHLWLELQEGMAVSAMFTQGNSPEILHAIEEALALAERLGERQRQLNLLAGLQIFLIRIGDFAGSLEVAQKSIPVADEVGKPAGKAMAELMVGCAHHLAGNQQAALHHSEHGLALSTALGASGIDFFGYDHRIRGLLVVARARWLCGFPDRALQVARQSMEEAKRKDDPINRCIAMIYTGTVLLWRGDYDEASEHLAALRRFASSHGLRPYAAVASAMTGELEVLRQEFASGVASLREALEVLHAEHHHVLTTSFLRALAQGLVAIGDFDEAERIMTASLVKADADGFGSDKPELLRVYAEIGLATSRFDLSAAEETLQKAVQLAESQQTYGWMLRAASSLGQIWAEQGRFCEATALLRPVYERFTEGFDTIDVRTASMRLAVWEATRRKQ
jgi:predicted ATPase/DNA-binding winged helix-turn-helix (wHTH) protein